MLSKEVWSTIFCVFGSIEPRSSWSLAKILIMQIWLISKCLIIIIIIYILVGLGLFNGISTHYGLFNAKIWLISKYLIIIIIIYILVWLGLFNGISTHYGLFNAKIWLISKCLIMIIYFFNISLQSYFFSCTFLFMIIICLHTVIWFQRFLSNTNNYMGFSDYFY